jgi:predicted acylesterase/phospholipase RssA
MDSTSTNEPQTPQRFCDLVMKGGITSGVVYPGAACELARAYCFRNIGGTSAGAIAAAATAAAERGRGTEKGGFRLLETLPHFLAQKPAGAPNPNLFYFFQPQPQTKAVFDTCVAALGGGKSAVLRVLLASCKGFWPYVLLGAIPGLAFALLAWNQASGLFLGLCILLGLGLALFLAAGLAGAAFYVQVTKQVPSNFFGLCTGLEGGGTSPGLALTPWLTGFLNTLAGRSPDAAPLTFGDLWGTRDPMAPRAINLEMMTTCLSHGRPYRLPFRDDDDVHENRQFFFRADEFEKLFPSQVVSWLKEHPRAPKDESARAREAEYLRAGYYPLPDPCDLPVIVAVRMSLSFPLLLSAVPLHAIDYSRTHEKDRVLERCWFSDGGISSNFPVHFFDSPLPRWPTFAITLAGKHPDHDPDFYLPKNNSAGTEHWTRFERDPEKPSKVISGVAQLTGFLGAIMNAMQNWSDNTLARLPGFRDRIAVITLSKDEGGLNLNMPETRINKLSARGMGAGAEFVARFATCTSPSKLNWPNHRWVRLRAGLAAIEENLLRLEYSCAEPLNNDPPYDAWMKDTENTNVPSYPWVADGQGGNWRAQRQLAENTLATLRRCAQALKPGTAGSAPLAEGAPRPRAELRVRPRV